MKISRKYGNSQIGGLSFACRGRIGGRLRAKVFSFKNGTMPLQSFSANIRELAVFSRHRRYGSYSFSLKLHMI